MIRVLKSLKHLHFYWSLLYKLYNVLPKHFQRSYLSLHWRVMQHLKKSWLVVWKMTWGIRQIFTKTLENVEIGTLMGSLYPKGMSWRFSVELYVIALGNDENPDKEWTCYFKIDKRNLMNFDRSIQKFQKFAL